MKTSHEWVDELESEEWSAGAPFRMALIHKMRLARQEAAKDMQERCVKLIKQIVKTTPSLYLSTALIPDIRALSLLSND